MARYKLPATVVLFHVCRLSAEVNDPTDLLHRLKNVNDQPLAAKDGTGLAHRAAATSGTAKYILKGKALHKVPMENSRDVWRR